LGQQFRRDASATIVAPDVNGDVPENGQRELHFRQDCETCNFGELLGSDHGDE
jgi:hypothetical protein